MKLYITTALLALLLSACLKQSIPDAMLAAEQGAGASAGITATLSYKINGNMVDISVPDAGKQDPIGFTLGIAYYSGYYYLDALSSTGEITFNFYTDSLSVGNYKWLGTYGDMYFIRYNGTDEYVHAASDSLSFTITSNHNGLVSGNFSGQLTPLVSAGTINNIYGAPGSISITNGIFNNLPVLY